MKTTEEKMAVMQAHLEGKPIEWAHSGFLHGKWVVTQPPIVTDSLYLKLPSS